MVWQRGEGCGADARLQAAPPGVLRGGGTVAVVVVVMRDSAHSGTSSVPDSRCQGKKIKSRADLNALAMWRLTMLSHQLWKFVLS